MKKTFHYPQGDETWEVTDLGEARRAVVHLIEVERSVQDTRPTSPEYSALHLAAIVKLCKETVLPDGTHRFWLPKLPH